MIFNFQTGSVTFSEEDQDYFEKRFLNLKKYLGSEAGSDEDSIKVRVTIEKNKHHAGERFECRVHMTSPHHGEFHTDVTEENIKKCADTAHEKLQAQINKFHGKHKVKM